jgi:hypothetical protein
MSDDQKAAEQMTIFTRRDIQRSIEILAGTLPAKEVSGLVDRLNRHTRESLAAEWETVVLAALSTVGRLDYEPETGGSTHLDVLFRRPDVEFLADVRTVSDINVQDRNPAELLWEEVDRAARRLGLTGAGLTLEIGDRADRTRRLLLPPKGELPSFVRENVKPFLQQVAAHPEADRALRVCQADVHLVLRYDSKEPQYSRGQWIDYTAPSSPDRNPLFNALKAKAHQLRSSGWRGLRGIVVCDGDCAALRDPTFFGGTCWCKEIVAEFFKHHPRTVSFVAVLEVFSRYRPFPPQSETGINPKLFWNPRQDRAPLPAVEAAFRTACDRLPKPARTPANALEWLKGKDVDTGTSFYGGFSMKGSDEIRISARGLIELLAGRIDQKRFLEDHGFLPTKARPQAMPFFQQKLAEKKMLQSVSLERCECEDDDWVVLRFGGPDAAVGPFWPPG